MLQNSTIIVAVYASCIALSDLSSLFFLNHKKIVGWELHCKNQKP